MFSSTCGGVIEDPWWVPGIQPRPIHYTFVEKGQIKGLLKTTGVHDTSARGLMGCTRVLREEVDVQARPLSLNACCDWKKIRSAGETSQTRSQS